MKKPVVELIDMNLIDPNPDNDTIFNMDALEYLAKGIKEEGFIGAIEVIAKPDGRYEISSGHRRYKAMELLREKEIPCIIVHNMDSIVKAQRLLSSNIKNRILKPMDYARAIRYFKENVGKPQLLKLKEKRLNNEPLGENADDTLEKICTKYFNMSLANLKRYESLLKLIKPLQDLTNEVEFPYSSLSPAATLSDVQQRELYENIKEHIRHNDSNKISGLRVSQMIDSIKARDKYKKQENGLTKRDKEQQMLQSDSKIVFEKTILNNTDSDVFKSNNKKDISNEILTNADNAIDGYNDNYESNIEYMDKMLEVCTEQIENIITDNYQIEDVTRVSSNLLKLKNMIKEIESKIKK